jgi:hypothetical protein
MPIPTVTATSTPPGRAPSSHTYAIPRVRELPRRLEPTTADTFGSTVVVRGTAGRSVRRGLP